MQVNAQMRGISPEEKSDYELNEQPGPFGSLIVSDGSRFQVVTPPRPAAQGKPAPTTQPTEATQPATGAPQKPLPIGALKVVDDAMQAIAATTDSQVLVDGAIAMLRGKKVELGAVANVKSSARNIAGKSNENSRAYASLIQSFEKLRNNYMLLAKGVQTDKDADRAWASEIGENVQRDNALALQQMLKAQAMIDRAIAAQNTRIKSVYGNYGQQVPNAPASGAAPADDPLGLR